MREFLLNLFGTDEGSIEITLFSIWHILYFVLIVGGTIGSCFLLRNKSDETKDKVRNMLADLVIGIYLGDFFIQPFMSSDYSMNVDKLPFHICTLMGIVVPFVQFNKKFEKIREPITCLSLVASLMYITYPGSALGGVAPFCYKVVQTFVFHGLLFSYGYLSVATNSVKLEFKNIWKELCVLVVIALWAGLGNTLYSSSEHHYDWFFITGSTFPFVPKGLMPFTVIAAVFGMCAIIYGLNIGVRKIIAKIEKKV